MVFFVIGMVIYLIIQLLAYKYINSIFIIGYCLLYLNIAGRNGPSHQFGTILDIDFAIHARQELFHSSGRQKGALGNFFVHEALA